MPKQPTFPAGIVGAIALFGIAWWPTPSSPRTRPSSSMGSAPWSPGRRRSGCTAVRAGPLRGRDAHHQPVERDERDRADRHHDRPARPLLVGLWPAAMGIYTLPANGSQVATVPSTRPARPRWARSSSTTRSSCRTSSTWLSRSSSACLCRSCSPEPPLRTSPRRAAGRYRRDGTWGGAVSSFAVQRTGICRGCRRMRSVAPA